MHHLLLIALIVAGASDAGRLRPRHRLRDFSPYRAASGTTIAPPVTVSVAASLVARTTATLNGTTNPSGTATTAWFRYHTANPGTCDDSFGTRTPSSGGEAMGAGSVAAAFHRDLTGLSTGTQYWFCAISENTGGKTYGSVLNFTTLTPPEIEFLAAGSSSGLTVLGTDTACSHSAFTSIATGAQAWCFEGDTGGTGLAFTRTGSSVTVTERECPNGIDCSTVSSQRMVSGSVNGWASAAQTDVDSDFACWAVVKPSGIGTAVVISKSTASKDQFYLQIASNGQSVTGGYTNTGDTTISSGSATAAENGGVAFIVMNVDLGASGAESGNMRIYSDRIDDTLASQGDSTSTGGGTMVTTSSAWKIGYTLNGGPNTIPSDILLAGCTQKLLSAAERLAMRNAVLGTSKDTNSTVVLTQAAKGTAPGCFSSSDSLINVLSGYRQCITGDGSGNPRMRVWQGVSNFAKSSDVFNAGTWGKLSATFTAPTVTANVVVGPDGSKTADQVDYPAITSGAGKYSYLRMTIASPVADVYSAGVWMRMASGTGKVYLMQKWTSGAYQNTTCNLTTTWSFCTNLNYTGVATNATDHQMFIGFDNDAGYSFEGLSAQTIYIAKAQWNRTRVLSTFCPTNSGSAVACSSDQNSFPTPAGISNTTGCMGITFTPQTTAAATTQKLLQFASGGYLGYDNNEVMCNDGTNTATLAISDPLDTEIRAVCTWTGATLTVKQIGGSSATATYDGAIKGATTYVGHNGAGSNIVNGWVRHWNVDDTTTGCD